MPTETIRVSTPSGIQLDLSIYKPDGIWNDVPGIYVFARKNGPNFNSLYVGKASSFKDRFASHEHWDRANHIGMSHILAVVIRLEADRSKIEAELIRMWQPPLNTLLK